MWRTRRRRPRCSASERRRRIAAIQDAAAHGEDIAAAARRLGVSWGLSRRTASRLARAALASWQRDRLTSARASFDAAIATRRRLYRLAVDAHDYSAASRILDRLEELVGISDEVITDEFVRATTGRLFGRVFEAIATELAGDPDALTRVRHRIALALRRGRDGAESNASDGAPNGNGRAPLDGRLNGTD